MSTVMTGNAFQTISREVRAEWERRRLEVEANRLLRKQGIRKDGRHCTERSMSVRVVYHHNGG